MYDISVMKIGMESLLWEATEFKKSAKKSGTLQILAQWLWK